MLDGGDFRERYEGDDPLRSALVPWWRAGRDGGPLRVEDDPGAAGERWLVTAPGQVASQPFAAYLPLAGGLRIEGRVRGRGVVTIVDGSGARAEFPVGADSEAFTIEGRELTAQLGHATTPRLEIQLASAGEGLARWTDVRALVPLPCPPESELRAEVVRRLDEIVATWLERGLDPRTAFIAHLHDAVTGAKLVPLGGGVFPLWTGLLEALRHEDRPEWRGPFEAFVESYLERSFAPATGLPARWDFDAHAPELDGFVEVHADLRFLLDLAEHGPARFRARALERARRIGEAVLERGVAPDGNVVAAYRPRDGAISLRPPLRRLDVPAQLARLGKATGDERFVVAVRNALAVFEYTHLWQCSWNHIDPGFDDDFGTYGARAVTMLASYPDETAFRALVASGYAYYVPRWRDALRFGGTVAADQVRCWRLLLEYAALEPGVAAEVRALVPRAARAHLKGEQYANGAFGDVTFANFDPQTGLEVGDLPGTPSNLLEGLALVHDAALDVDLDEVRALYTAVLRSTVEHYRRPYGYLMTERERADRNLAAGGLRLLSGLVDMLARLGG